MTACDRSILYVVAPYDLFVGSALHVMWVRWNQFQNSFFFSIWCESCDIYSYSMLILNDKIISCFTVNKVKLVDALINMTNHRDYSAKNTKMIDKWRRITPFFLFANLQCRAGTSLNSSSNDIFLYIMQDVAFVNSVHVRYYLFSWKV